LFKSTPKIGKPGRNGLIMDPNPQLQKWFYFLVLLSLILSGCRSNQEAQATSTRSGEELILTAQALAEQTRQATAQTPPPTPIPSSATPTLVTPTPDVTSTPSSARVIAVINANVRSGPDEVYEVVDFLLADESAFVLGKYENSDYTPSTWWFIQRVDVGKDGWVWGGVVEFVGNEFLIPEFEPPPTPMPTEPE
jgi:hypothetical protein